MNEAVFIQIAPKNENNGNDSNEHGRGVILTSKTRSLDCEQVRPGMRPNVDTIKRVLSFIPVNPKI